MEISFDFVFDSGCELSLIFIDCAVLVQPYYDLRVPVPFSGLLFIFFFFFCVSCVIEFYFFIVDREELHL